MPIFEALPLIIRKEKEYGKNIFRKGEFVGRGSAELAELLPFPYAKDMLKRHHLFKIVDMGCGSGDFLINFCIENKEFSGVGIDISPEVISFAERLASSREINGRVSFQIGDIKAIEKFKELIEEGDVLSFMFVLHEFLTREDNEVVRMLTHMKNVYPTKHILITEVYRRGVQELISRPVTVAEHHLFHKLSKQGLATLNEWKSIFNKAGLVIVEERRFDRAAQAYFLLRARF
jgi:SAM-dependent methyltransferase